MVPRELGAIEKRVMITPEKDGKPAQYQTSIKTIVLREAYDPTVGDIEWEVRSERLLISPAREDVHPQTGERILIPAQYKTVQKRVISRIHKRPPQSAIRLIHFLIPQEIRDALLGDIQEQYNNQIDVLGEKGAKYWVWKEFTFTFFNLFLDWSLGKVAKFRKESK